MSLPVLRVKEALEQKVRYFEVLRGCKVCGCRVRYVAGSFSTSNVACAQCEPETGHRTTIKNIKTAEEKRNRWVEAQNKKMWGIPVVFRSNIK
ncbi:hypothetical protein D3C80_774520 [compost metagenome]